MVRTKLRAAQLQTERDEHMLSIRKLQQSNRVLRGSGKELLALASPNLTPSRLAASSHASSAGASSLGSPPSGTVAYRHWAGSVAVP